MSLPPPDSPKPQWQQIVEAAYEHTCPICGADPHQDCRRPRRRGESFVRHHFGRRKLARDPIIALGVAKREARARAKIEARAAARAARGETEVTRLLDEATYINGITRKALGRALGISTAAMRLWEANGQVPRGPMLFYLRLLAGEDPDANRYLAEHPEAVSWQAWGYALRQRLLRADVENPAVDGDDGKDEP